MTYSSFDIDADCRAACERAKQRIHLAPMPVYEPRREDFDFPIWVMLAALVFAISLVFWRMPELLAIGAAV